MIQKRALKEEVCTQSAVWGTESTGGTESPATHLPVCKGVYTTSCDLVLIQQFIPFSISFQEGGDYPFSEIYLMGVHCFVQTICLFIFWIQFL